MGLEEIRARNTNGKMDKFLKVMANRSVGKQKSFEKEDTYYPERNKEGNGSAIIRFLPGLDSEDNPYYIERYQHGVKMERGWYVEFCPTTIDKPCPMCKATKDYVDNRGGYNSLNDEQKVFVGRRGRMRGFEAGYYCNILVIKDPANPENEGKVFLFKFGKAILNMIMEMAQPKDDGLGDVPDPVDVFDLELGANFKLIIRIKDGRVTYEKSEFEKPSPCPEFNHDDQTALLPLVSEKMFKSYDELEKRLAMVSGVKKSAPDEFPAVPPSSFSPDDTTDQDFEDNMEYFQGIADDIKI